MMSVYVKRKDEQIKKNKKNIITFLTAFDFTLCNEL